MKIASVRLKNFKRFTDLTVRAIPKTAKLVVVVGPNGCGKSSLFDAFLHWYRMHAAFGINNDEGYYRKHAKESFEWSDAVTVELHDDVKPKRGCLYVRTAYRNDPDFSVSGFNRPEVPSDVIRVNRIIENDQTVSANYQRLVYDTMAGVYDPGNDSKTVRDLREELIGQVRESMKRVFGDLLLHSISDPLGTGAFFFEKGLAQSYHYKNLSGGEKSAFDLLLDLHVKKNFFKEAIYCIDEVETHLHTRVQGALVREMVATLPVESQLWMTTHSLGVLRAAQAMAQADPGTVCILDFDGVDPDVPRELVPSSLGRVAWDKLLSLTLDDLSQLVAPKTVVVCEGSSLGNRRKDFDAEIYNRVLASRHPSVLFVSGGSSLQVSTTGVSVREALKVILPSSKVIALVDRDDKSQNEVQARETTGDLVLPERNLESYLFADDVLEALVQMANKPELLTDARNMKRDALAKSVGRGNPPDDLKSAAGDTYVGLKKLLDLQRCGDNTDAFMRDTLAPLIAPPMATYQALETAIVGRLHGTEGQS